MIVLPLLTIVSLSLLWSSGQDDALSLLCDGAASDAIAIEVVYQAEGEIHLSWEFASTEALWEYGFRHSADLRRYDEWLRTNPREQGQPANLSDFEHRINAAVRHGRLGVVRPLNCLEASLLARQIRLTSPEQMREFVAYVLRKETPEKTKIYWLSGPDEFPPKADRVQPLIRRDVQAGWRLYAVVHNHTGPAPVAAPSGSDAQYGLSWADEGAERFIVLGGLRAFDVSAPELRAFIAAEADSM